MNIKFIAKYIITLVAEIISFPFILATFIVSMLALGIYYLAYVVLLPAIAICRLASIITFMADETDANRKKLIKSPLMLLEDWLLGLADWKGV
jgi:hypothetical protein